MARKKSKAQTTTLVRVIENKGQMVSMKPKSKNKRKKRRAQRLPTPFLDYAQLIMDPCSGPLNSSISVVEGTIMERSRTVISLNTGLNNTSGYVIWYPSYSSVTGNANHLSNYNLFAYESVVPSVAPTNSTPSPMGIGLAATGVFVADPSSGFIGGTSSFARQKTLSACMQFDFLGALSSIAGQVAIVKNVSLATFDTGTGLTGHNYTPMSVDQIFAYASERTRTQIGGHEAVWRPSVNEVTFRTNGMESYTGTVTPASDVANVCFWSGQATTCATAERSTTPNEALGIIIAWKGLPATSPIQVTCVKTFALELAARSGAIESIPRQLSSSDENGRLSAALKWIDTMYPDWQSKIMNAGINKVGALAAAYAPAMIRGAARPGRNYLRLTDGEL